VTRACVERFVAGKPYDAGGLLFPVSFTSTAKPPATARAWLSVAQGSDHAREGHGGWVAHQGGDLRKNCFVVPQLPYGA
jgi:hypothetical protein